MGGNALEESYPGNQLIRLISPSSQAQDSNLPVYFSSLSSRMFVTRGSIPTINGRSGGGEGSGQIVPNVAQLDLQGEWIVGTSSGIG